MEEFITSTIISIITNLISNDLEVGKGSLVEKLKFKCFMKSIKKWIYEFCKENEGSIIFKDEFADYLQYHKPIEKICKFVCDFEYADKTEKEFIQELVQDCKSNIICKGKICGVIDELIIKNLFSEILHRVKKYLEKNLSSDQKYMIYQNIKSNAEVKTLLKEQGGETKQGIDKILKILEQKDQIVNQEIEVEIYNVLRLNLSKGQIKEVYKILPLMHGVSSDLEIGTKCLLKIISNYEFPEIDVWGCINQINTAEIRNDVVRTLILFNLENKEGLKKLSGKAVSNQLNKIVECLIENKYENFFEETVTEKNHVNLYNIELKDVFSEEMWLVRRITFLYMYNKPMHVKEDILRTILGEEVNFIEELIITESKVIQLLTESVTDYQIEVVQQKLREKKNIFELSAEAIQVKYYALLLQTTIIVKPQEIKDIISNLPANIKQDTVVAELILRARIRNEEISEEELIGYCVQTEKYSTLCFYLANKDFKYIRHFFGDKIFLLEKDVQLFSMYVQVVGKLEVKECTEEILTEYKEKYVDFLEYWIEVLRLSREKPLANSVLERWFAHELKTSLYHPDEELANILIHLECYEEAERVIQKIETLGNARPNVLRMKSMVLIHKEQFLDALNIFMGIFECFSKDSYVVNNIIGLSLQNKRSIKREVLEAAIEIDKASSLALVAQVYQQENRFDEAKVLLTKALLRAEESNYDVYHMYFSCEIGDKSKVQEVTCVDKDTAVILKSVNSGIVKIYCIYKEAVLPTEPYSWENAEHIYLNTAIQLGLIRQKKADEIIICGEKYVIEDIMPVEAYLFRICMKKLTNAGIMKQFSLESNVDGEIFRERFTEWMKANYPKNEDSYDWLEKYNDMEEIALPFYTLRHFTRLTLEQFILVLIEDSSVAIREVLSTTENPNSKYILSFSGLIALYKLGVSFESLASKDIVLTESLVAEIKDETEKIIDENNREQVSTLGMQDDKLFMQVTSDAEKMKWMSEAVSIKKYSEMFKTKINPKDISFGELQELNMYDLLGVCDYDALAIAKMENRTLVSAEEIITQLTQFRDVDAYAFGILDFLCVLDIEVVQLIEFMRRLVQFRFVVAINKKSVEIVRNAYMEADGKRREEIAELWDSLLDSVNDTEECYKEKYVPVMNSVIQQIDIENAEHDDFILQCLAHYALKYNNIRLEAYVNDNFEIEVRAYQMKELDK